MSPQAKSWLSDTVRSLRATLLKDLQDGLQETYRLSIPLERAGLDLERSSQRRRVEAWADEQARGANRGQKETVAQARARHISSGVKLVAATWLNRLVVLGQMEALGLVRTQVLTGGWSSPGFREFRDFAPALAAEESEGFPFLLGLIFSELALDLPGLFGEVGLTALVPMPTATLRRLVEALQAESLSPGERAGMWRDETLLGWVYQFWNDPEREDLDKKIHDGGKIESHELAAKTQLFTDRYMVEWMLQNSLGQLWFGLCERHGWTPEVVADGTLDRLEARRVEWRGKRERGEVGLEELMPVEPGLEERWKYWVPRTLVHEEALGLDRLSQLKLLDPACGSGHFLVIAFDLLAALYEEEARHRGVSVSREEIARSIVENNLHGIDIDPRAVQIAAAAVWLKLKTYAPKAELRQMNLVASNLGLVSLPADDPALLELERAVERETGIPARLTRQLVEALKGADHLGSLLKVDQAIERAIAEHERTAGLSRAAAAQGDLFAGYSPVQQSLSVEEAWASVTGLLAAFLARHSRSEDLGLRLRGQQLAAGVRFVRLLGEGQYHLVVGNPPYQNGGKAADFKYLAAHYPEGKADLYCAFLLRGLELAAPGGYSCLLTLRGWMFLGGFEKLRKRLLENHLLTLLGDLDRGGFEVVLDEVVAVAISLFLRDGAAATSCVAVLPTPRDDRSRDAGRTPRKRAALLCGVGRHEFAPERLAAVPGHPLIYWWDEAFLERYRANQKLGEISAVRVGMQTSENTRFLRLSWEVAPPDLFVSRTQHRIRAKPSQCWVPYIKGAAGKAWFEPLENIVRYHRGALEIKTYIEHRCGTVTKRVQNEAFYFLPGVAFVKIGAVFVARLHRFFSIFDVQGSSVFPDDTAHVVCQLNSTVARRVLESLNPTISFQVGDVNRLPLFPIASADEIVAKLDQAFTRHEQARENSVEFKRPGPSPWAYAQQWAQAAVDRPAGTPLPGYVPVEEPENPRDHLSFALGVALGRFGRNGEGILDEAPASALPHGILFLSASGGPDSLEHPAAQELREHALYLCTKFFAEDHLKRYEKRPIYFPLSSEKKSFVAWISIHRWADNTLQVLLADHLLPEEKRLAGELADLAEARTQGDKKAQVAAHKRYEEVLALHGELQAFAKAVQAIAERGAPCPGCTPREVDAPFRMDLDDGVMINSAALWPLLLPQWKDPKTWWVELCNAKGKKDYDWSHLAARYFPTRVDKKCQVAPSLAVAHGVFWKYHPEKAYQWELRLQSPDELGPDFRLEEAGADSYRADFERHHPDKVRELREAESRRRERKAGQAEGDQAELDFAEDEDEDSE